MNKLIIALVAVSVLALFIIMALVFIILVFILSALQRKLEQKWKVAR